jgi:FKBP-type peptidyl-prolyl cis-trans isomerase SlyD
MQIKEDKVVAFHYTLTSSEGEMIDTSRDQSPLEYLHGHRNIIQGLERSMTEKEVGSKFSVTLEPEQAYGPYDDSLVKTLSLDEFEDKIDLQPGMELEVELSGEPHFATVLEVAENQVKVDGNHPLAGETLVFDIEVTGIRDATQEELAHGHVHSHGHH